LRVNLNPVTDLVNGLLLTLCKRGECQREQINNEK
jgi:hypothetical protein